MPETTHNDILNLAFHSENYEKRITIREYLIMLAAKVWFEEEEFSGKRPFGNSNWKNDIYVALIKGKFIRGKLDEDGYIAELDMRVADSMILGAVAMWLKEI